MKKIYCWLIGSGSMAINYSIALQAVSAKYDVFGRGISSADVFTKSTGVHVDLSEINLSLLDKYELPRFAVVAVDIVNLFKVATSLIEIGVKNILLEKPGSTSLKELLELNDLALKANVNVFIAYNRRYYEQVEQLNEILMRDGGLINFHFEFTEHIEKVLSRPRDTAVLNEWLIANSSHVIDLAFFIGGQPQLMDSYVKGCLEWFNYGDTFVGAGVTKKGILFTYNSNWRGPGNWSLEFVTVKSRLKLSPMERLFYREHDSNSFNEVLINHNSDQSIKPGLVKMLEDFFFIKSSNLKTIGDQIISYVIYNSIQNGKRYNAD